MNILRWILFLPLAVICAGIVRWVYILVHRITGCSYIVDFDSWWNRLFEEATGGLLAGYVFSSCAAYIAPTGSKWVTLSTVGIAMLFSGIAIGIVLMSNAPFSADYYAGFMYTVGTVFFAVRVMKDDVAFLSERTSDEA